MANLSMKDKRIIEDLFDMGGGYVLDFSNPTFQRFVGESINIDIYKDAQYQEPLSKANKLRDILQKEPDNIVGKLLKDLLEYYENYKEKKNESLNESEQNKFDELKTISFRLLGNEIDINLPNKKEDDFQTLIEDINNSLTRNKPELVLDRLHTYSTKLLRTMCQDFNIGVTDNKGDYLPLHSLSGLLKNYFINTNFFSSEFTASALKVNIDLFDKFNSIRNNQSYAHDNEILNKAEAEYAVKAMANIITFIDKISTFIKTANNQKTNNVDDDDDLPF